EIQTLAFETLENIQVGMIASETKLYRAERKFLPQLSSRSAIFNELSLSRLLGQVSEARNIPNDKTEYDSKAELIESLVSDFQNVSFSSTSNMSINSDAVTTRASNISLQVKVEFLGVGINAGPQIGFKRSFESSVKITGEGLTPLI